MDIGDLIRAESCLPFYVVGWSVVWSLILRFYPRGESERDHILVLNAFHGLLSTGIAIYTLQTQLDTALSCATSISFFLVDGCYMAHKDGLKTITSQPNSRKLDYAHHVFGFAWGVVLHYTEGWICACSNPYVWIQTNEISTPFYNWYRKSKNPIAGALFAVFFFGSRVVFNTVVLMPKFFHACYDVAFWGCFPYFILQYVWFIMIIRKVMRSSASMSKKTR